MAEPVAILKELLDKIAKENNISDYDVEFKQISTEGASYSSQLYLATISGGSDKLNLFAKVNSFSANICQKDAESLFLAEPFVYTELSKIYRHLEDKHNVADEYRLEFPKFYGQNPTRGQEALVLEDLTAQGFSVYDRFKPVTYTYAFDAIRELAKFHALSYTFVEEYPDEFKNASKILKVRFWYDDNFNNMLSKGLETAISVTREENKLKVLEYFTKTSTSEFAEYMRPLRRSTLVHGDFRMSNLMHKADNNGAHQIRILDYQTMHIGSPVADLLFFIFTGTDEEFRSKHYFPLLDHYYAQLSLAMRRLGLEPSEIYSREDFDYEMKQKLPYGLLVGAIILPYVLVDAEDAPVIDKDTDFSNFTISKTGKLYPERFNGIVNDYIRWQFL